MKASLVTLLPSQVWHQKDLPQGHAPASLCLQPQAEKLWPLRGQGLEGHRAQPQWISTCMPLLMGSSPLRRSGHLSPGLLPGGCPSPPMRTCFLSLLCLLGPQTSSLPLDPVSLAHMPQGPLRLGHSWLVLCLSPDAHLLVQLCESLLYSTC